MNLYCQIGNTLQSPTNIIEYKYENANWKDQLTEYSNLEITYDAIGNSLTYNRNTYIWKRGRQLSKIQNTNNNKDIIYKYDESGIRTENGITTKYYLVCRNSSGF